MDDLEIQLALDAIAIALLKRGYDSDRIADYLTQEVDRVQSEIDRGDIFLGPSPQPVRNPS